MLKRNVRPRAPAHSDPSPSTAGGAALPSHGAQVDGAPGAAVLDVGALDRLRELDPKGENKLLERVVKAFQGSVARLVPQLLEGAQAVDLNTVRHVAHTLKSSSASIGATRLSRLCAELEAMARAQNVDNLGLRVAALNAEIDVVMIALNQLLGEQA